MQSMYVAHLRPGDHYRLVYHIAQARSTQSRFARIDISYWRVGIPLCHSHNCPYSIIVKLANPNLVTCAKEVVINFINY